MAVWYIKKSDEQNTFIRKIKQILNVIEVENKEGKIIYCPPVYGISA